jgi:hypothetical protein
VVIFFDRGSAPPTIRLDGVIDIGCAGELKAVLGEAIASGADAEIAVDDVTALDATAIQLLWAAERAGASAGVRLHLASSWPESVASTLRDAGFARLPFAPDAP